jgi:hypothetical protein
VAVQSVSFQMRREREEELVFRGQQYVEGIRMFRARNGRFPVAIKELWDANPRVLRKKWNDPITGEANWQPIFQGQEGQEVGGSVGGGLKLTPTPTPEPTRGRPRGVGRPPSSPEGGPIIGVRSSSCDESIKLYDGRNRYCDWKFFFDPNKQGRTGQGGGPGPSPTARPSP